MKHREAIFAMLAVVVLVSISACGRKQNRSGSLSSDVVLEQDGMVSLQKELAARITAAPSTRMRGSGLAGAMGGAHVKVNTAGPHEIQMPIPQWTDGQIPISYAITATPTEACTTVRLCTSEDATTVVLQLNTTPGQDVQINWAAVVLLTGTYADEPPVDPQLYLQESACVQSGSRQITALAETLWPENGRVDVYATKIQQFIRNMKQSRQPRSLDAVSILESGANWICTANANLGAALMRARGIPAQSLAVIPTTSQRLEMHRIVACFDKGQWNTFDPSSLHRDIPMKPWQYIIMAKTTMADEDMAMKPRMGMSFGCPYGQEIELLDAGVTLWGQDFFWTQSKPLKQFDVSDKVIDEAKTAWTQFLKSGTAP